MQQKSVHTFIYKIESKRLKKAKWKLTLPLSVAMKTCPDTIVSLNESECLRFINEINNVKDINDTVRHLQKKIREVKKLPKSRESKKLISSYYDTLYNLQFQKDYVCVIMNSESDYDRANKGFSIDYGDGCVVRYRRFLGTNGGIKNSTIVYVNANIYGELKKRLDNGRDMTKELVPAKLEAYQALICSGSTPIPPPNGIIVVDDCITKFKEDVILIDDTAEGEPKLTYENNYEIEHNNSDGFGLMLPSYSKRVNEFLSGKDDILSGFICRYAWCKGSVFTFDYVEFAEKIAGRYEITDVWGDKRDIRDAEVILTASMLKLWESYSSWEDYYKNCEENHYRFSATKTTPDKLENVRDTNYQFLQSYEFTDRELSELCQPTIDEIKEVIGLDCRKSLTFLAGFSLTDDNAFGYHIENYVKALMIDKRMINDPFVKKKIQHMIKKRIDMGKKGAIRINANYAIISGDPYALCQSMFGLPVVGLLKAGEVYHKYWLDKGADEIVLFRAPMTNHNNIKKLKLNKEDKVDYWFKYMSTVLVLNTCDTTCDALNGADFDGDTSMSTDNKILLDNTKNLKTIVCLQKKASKKIPTEEDIISSNKIAFNDEIGEITNRVTTMFEVQSGYPSGSKEYKELEYRIMCGQKFQQDTIDRAKGVICKPMPTNWYIPKENNIKDGDTSKIVSQKKFYQKIVADKKPYFMTYIYPKLRIENNKYIKNNKCGAIRRFNHYGIKSIDDLYSYEEKTNDMKEYLKYYEYRIPVGNNPCVVNRISWLFEEAFKKDKLNTPLNEGFAPDEFDYSILKSGVAYSKVAYNKVYDIYKEYCRSVEKYKKESRTQKIEKYEKALKYKTFVDIFKSECERVCTNEDELCDIVLDICYTKEKSKQFAWDICACKILENLLAHNGNKYSYPKQVENDGEFSYCGRQFIMCEKEMKESLDDNS